MINDVATVQITFRVEQAMRGTRAGQILTIREWAGLWNSGERYHPENAFCCFSTVPATGPHQPGRRRRRPLRRGFQRKRQ